LRNQAKNGVLVIEFNLFESVSEDRLPFDETYLREKLNSNPADWDTRLRLADGLFEKEAYAEAAEMVWSVKYVPSNDLDLALVIRILSKAQPRKAIRLVTAVLELNQGSAAHNIAMANAMIHYGMVLQATRFYGAALVADPSLANPDLEYLILWSDDKSTMRGQFEKKLSKLGQTAQMVRNPKEALNFTARICLHETGICPAELANVPGEEFNLSLHDQSGANEFFAPAAVSKSLVPTSLLHVKWNTPPSKPGGDTAAIPPVAPPITPQAEQESAPGPRRLNMPGMQ
jgi:tetratricopeptide (TPR) repeat protein